MSFTSTLLLSISLLLGPSLAMPLAEEDEELNEPLERYDTTSDKEKLIRTILIVLAIVLTISITGLVVWYRRRKIRRVAAAEEQLRQRSEIIRSREWEGRLKRMNTGGSSIITCGRAMSLGPRTESNGSIGTLGMGGTTMLTGDHRGARRPH